MDLSIIVVNYNTSGLLRACLTALQKHPLRAGVMETWVIDNASGDGSAGMVRFAFPAVRLVANSRNVGFAAANNQAMEQCAGRYLLLLNPDTEVTEGALDELLRFMDARAQVAAAGAQLLNEDGSVQMSCRRFPTLCAVLLRGSGLDRLFPRCRALHRYLMTDWDHAEAREVDWLLGACLLLRRTAVEQVGMLDPGFFMYYEDIDWCRRAWQAGWAVYYVPSSRIRHLYRRESARGLNRLTWIHLSSIARLFGKHRFPLC